MNKEIVKKTEAFLDSAFSGSVYFSDKPADREYRLEHSRRVANIGRIIAGKEGFDETETVVACLLHDVAYCEEFGENGWKEHGRRSAAIARPFLKELGFSEDRINDICYGIAIHVDDEADFDGERTPFALTVGDADNIDRFDVYRIHEWLANDRFLEISSDEKLEYVEKRIERLKKLSDIPMGTAAAEALWKDRIGFCIGFFERLAAQLRSGRGLCE